MSDPTGTPFNTERELAEDDGTGPAARPDLKEGPSNPPVDEEALQKGEETLDRVKPY